MTPEQRLHNLLAAMGGTVEEVMTTLAEYGIDNRPRARHTNRGATCPIAQYLSLRLRSAVWVTDSLLSLQTSPGEPLWLLETPPLISRVIQTLDQTLDDAEKWMVA